MSLTTHGVNFAEYVQKLAKPLPETDHLSHMALGAAGEVGELVDAIKKHVIYEKAIDRVNVVEELGDLAFYMQGIMNPLGITWQEIIDANYVKLGKRYEGLTFSVKAAVTRADKLGDKWIGCKYVLGQHVHPKNINAQEATIWEIFDVLPNHGGHNYYMCRAPGFGTTHIYEDNIATTNLPVSVFPCKENK